MTPDFASLNPGYSSFAHPHMTAPAGAALRNLRRPGERINEGARRRGLGGGSNGIVDDPMIPQSGNRPNPRLYLLTPLVGDPATLSRALAEIARAVDVAAVLLRMDDADERSLINRAKAVAPSVQGAGAALIIAGRPDIVARAGADGAHLVGADALQAVIETLKPNYIAGAGGLRSRHDAMVAAEAGADYVMFGEPDAAGHRPSRDAVVDRVAWWAEVFEIPCVGYAAALDDIDALAAAGADFVAVGDALFEDSRGPEAAAAEAAARLTVTETTT
jgi:thiamine-phosphate pyrophosphorylase